MVFGNNGSVSRNTALSVLLGCLMMGVLIGLSPISPLDRASNNGVATAAGARTTNLREGATPPAKVVATIEEVAAIAPEADIAAVEEDKSAVEWPTSRKMIEDEEGDGFAEGQGAWGPDDEEMEDWVDLWGGVDLVGAVNDADMLADDEFSFSYDI